MYLVDSSSILITYVKKYYLYFKQFILDVVWIIGWVLFTSSLKLISVLHFISNTRDVFLICFKNMKWNENVCRHTFI